jgi:hypothetical protein
VLFAFKPLSKTAYVNVLHWPCAVAWTEQRVVWFFLAKAYATDLLIFVRKDGLLLIKSESQFLFFLL